MMESTLPVINRSVETEVISEGMPVWTIGIMILLGVLILLLVILLLIVILKGKTQKSSSAGSVEKEKISNARVKVALQKKDDMVREAVHSTHTQRLWYGAKEEDVEIIYLIVRDIARPERLYKIEMDTEVVIGRTKGDILLPEDNFVSSRHCTITYENGILFVQDAGSSNGTYYQNHKITGKTAVVNGETIKVGNTQLKLSIKKA